METNSGDSHKECPAGKKELTQFISFPGIWYQRRGHVMSRMDSSRLIRPEKIDEPNRTRLVAGGDRVHYPFDTGTPTANLLTIKLLINSVISTPGTRFFTMDIKNSI
jgi:hypothetical protein